MTTSFHGLQAACTIYGRSVLGVLDPVRWLGVRGVINFLRGVDGGVEVLKQAAALLVLAVNQHSVAASAYGSSLTCCVSENCEQMLVM